MAEAATIAPPSAAVPPPGVPATPAKSLDLGMATMPRGMTAAQLVRQANRWRENYNPLRGLVMSRVVSMLEAGERGEFAELQWFYRFVEKRYPVLRGLVARRRAALLKLDWDIKIVSELPEGATAAMAERQQKFLRSRYELIGNLRQAIKHLALAEFRGFSMCAKHRFDGGKNDGAVAELHWLPHWNICRDGGTGDWYWNPTAAITSARSLQPEFRIDPANVIVREEDMPIDEIAAIAFVRTNLAMKDWAAFIEIFGLPGAVVIGPPNVPTGKEAEYESAGQSVAEGASGYLPNGSSVEFPSSSVRGNAPFKEYKESNSEDVVIAGTGGKLSMLNEPTGIGGSQGKEHGDAFDEIAQGEAGEISEIFQKQFDKCELEAEFPNEPHLVYFELAADDTEDSKALVENYGIGVRAGVITANEDDEAYFREKLGLPGMSAAVKREWKKQGGARSPITIQSEGEPAGGGGLFGRGAPAGPPSPSGRGRGEGERPPVAEDDEDTAPLRNRLNSQLPRSQQALAASLAADLAPLLRRLDAIQRITDPDIFRAKLEALRADFDSLAADVKADPESARALERIAASALARGLNQPPRSQTSARP